MLNIVLFVERFPRNFFEFIINVYCNIFLDRNFGFLSFIKKRRTKLANVFELVLNTITNFHIVCCSKAILHINVKLNGNI